MDDTDDHVELEVGESNLQETLCRREGSFIYDSDATVAVCANRAITAFVITPVNILGILGNLMVMWVWSLELGYHPTTYLFKALALADTLALLVWALRVLVLETFFKNVILHPVSLACRRMGVQITMLLAIVRFISLFFPFRSEQLLTRFRINSVLAGFIVWNLSVYHVANYLRLVESARYPKVRQIVTSIISTSIPAGLQLILMIAVTCKVWRVFKRVQPSTTDHGRAVLSRQNFQIARQFAFTVFAMCVLTFTSYFVPAYVFVFIQRSRVEGKPAPYRLLLHAIFGAIGAINSSINIVFYVCFIVRFRDLLFKKLRKIRQNFQCRCFFFSFLESTFSRKQTITTSPDGDEVIIHKESPEDATGSKLPACSFIKTVDDTDTKSCAARASFDTYVT